MRILNLYMIFLGVVDTYLANIRVGLNLKKKQTLERNRVGLREMLTAEYSCQKENVKYRHVCASRAVVPSLISTAHAIAAHGQHNHKCRQAMP